VQLNKVEIAGALARDPETRFTENAWQITTFTVIVKTVFWDAEAHEDKTRSDFIGCVSFGETAASIVETYRKGDVIYVMGSLAQHEVPKAGGKTERKTRVSVGWVRGIRRGKREKDTAVDTPPPY
jgi:single-strand DNA-binding protein